jgi:hypothetical protein
MERNVSLPPTAVNEPVQQAKPGTLAMASAVFRATSASNSGGMSQLARKATKLVCASGTVLIQNSWSGGFRQVGEITG